MIRIGLLILMGTWQMFSVTGNNYFVNDDFMEVIKHVLIDLCKCRCELVVGYYSNNTLMCQLEIKTGISRNVVMF